MGTVFRKAWTAPLPPGAEIVVQRGKRLARYQLRNGKVRTAEVFTAADGRVRIRGETKSYIAKFRDAAGYWVERPTGCSDETAARAVLAQLVRRAELIRAGVITPEEDAASRHGAESIDTNLDAWRDHLRLKGSTEHWYIQARRRVARVRMMTVIEDGAARQRAFGEQLAHVYGSIATDIWDLVAPQTSPSILHWLTAFGPSPWALSLLATVATEEDAQWLLTGPGPGTLDERVHALIAIAMQVANLGLNEDHNLYRMSDGARRMLGWIASHEPDEARQAILKGWSEPIDWTPPDSLTKALEGVEQKDVHVQRWLCHAIRQRVSVGALAGDDLWGIVSSDVWKKSTWQNIDRIAAQALGCALVDDAARRRPEWAPHLVHLFTETAEQRAGNEEDRQAFFGLVLRGSCAMNASSAICRLLRGRAGHRFRPLATVIRGNLEQVLPQAGGWAAGRLRAVLVDLAQ